MARNEAVETFEVSNGHTFTVEIHSDDTPSNPREWDNLGHMVCFHRNYRLGDKHAYGTPTEFREFVEHEGKEIALILPLYLYDHSGLSMSVSDFGDRWDSGQVGFIYVTRERLRKEYTTKRITRKVLTNAEKVLRGEVETFDQYLRGEVYGYIVKDRDGEDLDSCWGFFGLEYAKEAATDAAKSCVSEADRVDEFINRCFAL